MQKAATQRVLWWRPVRRGGEHTVLARRNRVRAPGAAP